MARQLAYMPVSGTFLGLLDSRLARSPVLQCIERWHRRPRGVLRRLIRGFGPDLEFPVFRPERLPSSRCGDECREKERPNDEDMVGGD